MTIEEIIYSTPIPRHAGFLNSEIFRVVLWIKSKGLHALVTEENKVDAIEVVLSDFESVKEMINDIQNLTFVRYVIGTKFIELGLKYEKDNYLVKGIDELDRIDENLLSTIDLKTDYYRLFSRSILVHFNNELEKNIDYQYSFENIQPLLKAKYYLFKLFSFLLEKNIELKNIVEARVISDLISVLLFLSRWTEPFYILGKRTVIAEYSPGFLNYLKAHTLNEIAWNSCCTIYPAMTFEIKKFIKAGISFEEDNDEWKKHLFQIKKEVDEIIENNKFDLAQFEIKYKEANLNTYEHTTYRQWILENHIALCEHSLYCSCAISKSDDLRIKSSHEHTGIGWADPFETILDKIKTDFNLSRYFLFLSENDHQTEYIRDDELKSFSNDQYLINNTDSDYLIQAFKSAYSILDKIGRAIYFALEIEADDIYFHKCWKKIKEQKTYSPNRYLYSLYSIACDLSDTSKYSAFLEYKKWRNSIEYEFFFLVEDYADIAKIKNENRIISEVIKIGEFREKTHYMLQLCQSAIFSFVFFIRHESKNKRGISGRDCLANSATVNEGLVV